MKNAIIYYRVSTKEQVEGNSLNCQKQACQEYARRNNFSVLKIFTEEGESAKTADRTELNKMMEYCQDNYKDIEALIIHKVDRLSRNTNDYLAMKLFFNHLTIRVCSASESLADDPAGRFAETIFAAQAQFDNEVRAERSKRGMIAVVEDGRWPWKAPLGYTNTRIAGVNNITPEDPYCEHIKKIFEMVATGIYRPEEVRQIAYNNGFRETSGHEVSNQHFHKIIRNKLYMGVIEAFDKVVEGKFERIIEPELFYKAQEVLEGKAKKLPKYVCVRPDFPLRGLLFDSEGIKLSASWSTGRNGKFPYYHSKNVRNRKEKVEEAFAEYLQELEFKDEQVICLKTALKKNWTKRNEANIKRKGSLTKEITELKTKQDDIIERNLRGVFSDDLARTKLGEIDQLIKDRQAELTRIPDFQEDLDSLIDYGLSYVSDFSDRWKSINDLETKQRFQNFLFPSGLTYFGEKKFGTAVLPLLIRIKSDDFSEKTTLAAPRGVEPLFTH